jgi:hypothetical protein
VEIAATAQMHLRNDLGQFIRDCEAAAGKTIEAAVTEGADLSRDFAPVGHKADPRTIPLKDSIEAVITSRTSGFWQATARHALPQELGAGPHGIPGNVKFYWEEEGRWWEPGDNEIQHPGNRAQPYLRPAYDIIKKRLPGIMQRYYPG